MAKNKEPPVFSEVISGFCKMLDEVKSDYEWNYNEVNRLDKLTQDYLHMLELDNLDYRERAKVATKIRDCRRDRRASKDTTEILEPIVEFLNSDKGRNMVNLMREVLGKTRKAESKMKNRTYRYKVYNEGEM